MKTFHRNVIVFWFVLLTLAIINAVLREATYKPLLLPYIGMWAHQISSVTGILLFFTAIYVFLKREKEIYSTMDLIIAGFLWIAMTVIFESLMNYYVRKLSFSEILKTYYFWNGEMWIFVLVSLLVSPLIAQRMLKK